MRLWNDDKTSIRGKKRETLVCTSAGAFDYIPGLITLPLATTDHHTLSLWITLKGPT